MGVITICRAVIFILGFDLIICGIFLSRYPSSTYSPMEINTGQFKYGKNNNHYRAVRNTVQEIASSSPKKQNLLDSQPEIQTNPDTGKFKYGMKNDYYGVIRNDVQETVSSSPQKQRGLDNQAEMQTNPDILPLQKFSLEISNILSPEIFAQANPVTYLLDKVSKLSYTRALYSNFEMRYFLKLKDKFSPRYLPYAKVLKDLLECRSTLEIAKQRIKEIGNFSESHQAELPAEAFSPKLFDLFSSDIFSDVNPPNNLIVKLMNIPLDQKENLEKELAKLLQNPKLVDPHLSYAQELRTFVSIKTNFLLKELKQHIFELQNFLKENSPST